METRNLFEILQNINREINKQIPLATNRFEEFETCAPTDDQAANDQLDARYAIHAKRYHMANIEFYINDHLNNRFKQFCKDQHLSFQEVAKSHEIRAKLKDIFIRESNKICEKLNNTEKKLNRPTAVNTSFIKNYLNVHCDTLLDTLVSGVKLTLSNPDFEYRIRQDEKLVAHRGIEMEEFAYRHSSNSTFEDKDEKSSQKAYLLWRGVYYDRINTDVGFCDEHAAISMVRLLRNGSFHFKKDIFVECIGISYEEGDGHTFLAINRDPTSKLSDITSWGKNAYLYDSWNKLVCKAEEYHAQPIAYLSYPNEAKWEVRASFNGNDKRTLETITTNDLHFYITGNQHLVDRIPRIMEEYELTSLDVPPFEHTKAWLDSLLNLHRPVFFDQKIDIYITNAGQKPLCVIDGLERPAVAIHKDYLRGVIAKDHTIRELLFALAHCVSTIHRYNRGLPDLAAMLDQHAIDSMTIEATGDGEAAISYLRKCILFSDAKKQQDNLVGLNLFQEVQEKAPNHIYLQRIKNINTFLAANGHLNNTTFTSDMPTDLLTEFSAIKTYDYFTLALNKLTNNVDKINYLIDQLPELRIELTPMKWLKNRALD